MNKTARMIPLLIVSVFALALPFASTRGADEKAPPDGTEKSQLATSLQGTWILVGEPGNVGEIPAAGGRLKFIAGRHWNITEADPNTGLTIFHHGGTYTLRGNEYVETIEYANESTKELIKNTFKFKISIDGDTLTQTGVGNEFNEVWKRAK